MAYPMVPARYDYGPRKGPALAFVVHMAEGGGTVGYLAGPNVARGVSVHYVIEYSGRIVQMLAEGHASGSVNPAGIRTTDDPTIGTGFAQVTYGRTAAVACLGSWADDPNSAVISVEVEGYAKFGPNADESMALQSLVADVRGRHPGIGLLGHRDFAAYKACPGKFIPWALLGGHGPAKETDVPWFPIRVPGGARAGTLDAAQGVELFRVSDGATVTAPVAVNDAAATSAIHDVDHGSPGFIFTTGGVTYWARAEDVAFTAQAEDCEAEVRTAHDATKAAAVAAVQAIP